MYMYYSSSVHTNLVFLEKDLYTGERVTKVSVWSERLPLSHPRLFIFHIVEKLVQLKRVLQLLMTTSHRILQLTISTTGIILKLETGITLCYCRQPIIAVLLLNCMEQFTVSHISLRMECWLALSCLFTVVGYSFMCAIMWQASWLQSSRKHKI